MENSFVNPSMGRGFGAGGPVNNPTYSNTYQFENSEDLSRFVRQMSHNAGVTNVSDMGNKAVNVDFRDDAFRQQANDDYSNCCGQSNS